MRGTVRLWSAVALCAVVVVVAACGGGGSSSSSSGSSGTPASGTGKGGSINVAIVDNPQMKDIAALTPKLFTAKSGIKVNYTVLDEGTLRQVTTRDVAAGGRQFDVAMIGPYEAPQFGKDGTLVDLTPQASADSTYNLGDLIPAVRSALSNDGKLYASPFYGESSFLMYRKDLLKKAGLTMPAHPTWDQVAAIARKLNTPSTAGICLRGKPGWGDNMAFITTMVNSYGGQWFDMSWKPQLETKPWHDAITAYVDLLKKYGPPGSSANSFNEILALYNEGKCAMWIDATIAASFITDPKQSKVADKVAFAQGPYSATQKGANWLWAWALAIPAGTKNADAAQKFINWATSKEYIALVAKEKGWSAVPTGTRKSTYDNPEFVKAASFAGAEKKAIDSANANDSTLPKSPYVGVQFAAIPEFQAIGIAVGQQMSSALAGKVSVDEALKASQTAADREMKKGGYYK